jgi:hypothetical protein
MAIFFGRDLYLQEAQKSFNTFSKRFPMKKAGSSRFGSASRRGDGWTSDSSVTTDPFTRLIPHIINAVKALKRPGRQSRLFLQKMVQFIFLQKWEIGCMTS